MIIKTVTIIYILISIFHKTYLFEEKPGREPWQGVATTGGLLRTQHMNTVMHIYIRMHLRAYTCAHVRTVMVCLALIWPHMYSVMQKFGGAHVRVHVYTSRKRRLKHAHMHA
jgi:hypothetical protein